MLMTSLKTNGDLYDIENNPFVFNEAFAAPNEKQPLLEHGWLPLGAENITTRNYSFLFNEPGVNYVDWLLNTAFVGGIVVLITLALSLPAGYALARLSGSWGQSAGVGIFLVYLVPPTLLFLPLSRVVAELGFQDRLTSLILVYPSFTVPFSTWLLMGFFKTIPPELEDAAMVDGASRLKALTRIVFPISLPGILTVVIFSFSLCVNEFIYAVTFISTSDARTVSTGVPLELIRGDVYFWQSLMAATLIPAIPLALLYNMFLDRFIAGFTGGAFR
jgi:multiple sugar transport system permease protein